jgi:hypothetical protein
MIGRESDLHSCFASHLDVGPIDRQCISALSSDDDHLRTFDQDPLFSNVGSYSSTTHGHFGIVFPTLVDLIAFSQAAYGLLIFQISYYMRKQIRIKPSSPRIRVPCISRRAPPDQLQLIQWFHPGWPTYMPP